ncbi:hypothetical protein, variant 1 [Aphanomyces invadans]|uniref:Uncharacterized protein n=1 Tax=Aphanomyces invadans TaxID=157072 RepID=A0A024UG64_9STRA|nr:hypothetical protein, variant 1 [Aphanomyces invadans]ETW04628.1 hypothetical protein, variant 1 [Aphanomyces invadans]|eukprot:XP_008866065.1 hypothetical protein, variant 1 [Aphanomyces invadans]
MVDEAASKKILELLQSKDAIIEELNEEKMVLMEQLEQALWDLEHAISKNNDVVPRQQCERTELADDASALHTTLYDQLRALERQVSDMKHDDTIATCVVANHEELSAVRSRAHSKHEVPGQERRPHNADEYLQRNPRVEMLQSQAQPYSPSHDRCLKQQCTTENPQQPRSIMAQSNNVSATPRLDDLEATPKGLDAKQEAEVFGLTNSAFHHVESMAAPGVSSSTASTSNGIQRLPDNATLLRRQLDALTLQWQQSQADHVTRIRAYEVRIQTLQDEVADSRQKLRASETEAMTLLQSLQRTSETLNDIDIQHQKDLALQANDHATQTATWQAKVDQLEHEKQELIHHAALVMEAAESASQATSPRYVMSVSTSTYDLEQANAIATENAVLVQCLPHHDDQGGLVGDHGNPNGSTPQAHRSTSSDTSPITSCTLMQHAEVLRELDDLQVRHQALIREMELEKDTSRQCRDHIDRLERQLGEFAAVVAAQDNVQAVLESKASFALLCAARAIQPATSTTASMPSTVDDWIKILTDLWTEVHSTTSVVKTTGEHTSVANVSRSTLLCSQLSPRLPSSPHCLSAEEDANEISLHRDAAPEHMCAWYLQAKKWEHEVQLLQLEKCSYEDMLNAVRQAKAASDAEATAARAALLTWQKKASLLQADIGAANQTLEHVQGELRSTLRDRGEMDHMIHRLREESSRLKNSVRRKQELIGHLKRSLDAAKRALAEEKKTKPVASSHAVPAQTPRLHQPPDTTRWQQLAQHLQGEIALLKTDQCHLRSRCATLLHAVKLKDKMLHEYSTSPQATATSTNSTTASPVGDDASSTIIKDLKRRLLQKQLLVDTLKAKGMAHEAQRLEHQQQVHRLQAKLHVLKLGTW